MGTAYREIVKAVARFFKSPPLCAGQPVLVIDATGVGSAVTHRQDAPGRWNVAKKALASTLQVLLGSRRLLISDALPEARTLKDELGKLTVRITEALNETYEAWRENEHDDLVLACGLAAWAAERLDVFKPRVPAAPGPRGPRA